MRGVRADLAKGRRSRPRHGGNAQRLENAAARIEAVLSAPPAPAPAAQGGRRFRRPPAVLLVVVLIWRLGMGSLRHYAPGAAAPPCRVGAATLKACTLDTAPSARSGRLARSSGTGGPRKRPSVRRRSWDAARSERPAQAAATPRRPPPARRAIPARPAPPGARYVQQRQQIVRGQRGRAIPAASTAGTMRAALRQCLRLAALPPLLGRAIPVAPERARPCRDAALGHHLCALGCSAAICSANKGSASLGALAARQADSLRGVTSRRAGRPETVEPHGLRLVPWRSRKERRLSPVIVCRRVLAPHGPRGRGLRRMRFAVGLGFFKLAQHHFTVAPRRASRCGRNWYPPAAGGHSHRRSARTTR